MCSELMEGFGHYRGAMWAGRHPNNTLTVRVSHYYYHDECDTAVREDFIRYVYASLMFCCFFLYVLIGLYLFFCFVVGDHRIFG